MSETNGTAAAAPDASVGHAGATGQPAAAATTSPSYDQVANSMQRGGVRDEISGAVVEWLRDPKSKEPSAAGAHGYSFDDFTFLPSDRATLDNLGNALKAKGATQQDVAAVLSWYKGLPAVARADVEMRRQVEATDLQHRDEVGRTLRGEWGGEYAVNVDLINRYLDRLPAQERDAIESKILSDGRRALNDAATLRDLAQRARGGAVPTGEALSKEIADIERLMRENRAAYLKDAKSQARLRDLYRARDGA